MKMMMCIPILYDDMTCRWNAAIHPIYKIYEIDKLHLINDDIYTIHTIHAGL